MADGIGVRGRVMWSAKGAERCLTAVRLQASDEPFLAIPLDAESLAGLRERIAGHLAAAWVKGAVAGDYGVSAAADAVLAALGLSEVIAP